VEDHTTLQSQSILRKNPTNTKELIFSDVEDQTTLQPQSTLRKNQTIALISLLGKTPENYFNNREIK